MFYGVFKSQIKDELLIMIKPILRNLYNEGIIKDKIFQNIDIFLE